MALLAGCGGEEPEPYVGVVDVEAIVRTCVMEVSCLADPLLDSASECVWGFENGIATGAGYWVGAPELIRFVGCARDAKDCTEALRCASYGHDPAWCAAHSGYNCDGEIEAICWSGWAILSRDC